MTRRICVHGHFYQPPRENPWLEAVERQPSAAPYRDWNDRITAECYAPNTAARVLDQQGRIERVVNTYSRMSFDIGPTLLGWLERHAPQVHAAIVAADAESVDRFGGHGSAMAQAHSHVIMPLANARDRRTQVAWGVADFLHHFGRPPEGMWLPETAVDLDTLEALVEHGIRFTVLEPGQARAVRARGSTTWQGAEHLDIRRPHHVRLPSGRRIAVFFYDGAISRAIAFEGLLADGAALAGRLVDQAPHAPGVLSVATDGESYGHHHRHGEMALAFALARIDAAADVELTSFAEVLDHHPPRSEVELRERTSWSCRHGVARWRQHCGCADGGHPEWTQRWRHPLRLSLDWLRDEVAPRYEAAAWPLLRDPWAARDAYITVLLDRTDAARERFLAAHARRPLQAAERSAVWKLLECQRHAMLMFTSCGWFFDDLARIETIQVLRYAARLLDLSRDVLGVDLEPEFVTRLSAARSNDPRRGNGRAVWRSEVDAARIGPSDLAAAIALADEDELLAETDAFAISARDDGSGRGEVVVRERLTAVETRIPVTVLEPDRVAVRTADGTVEVTPDDLPPELRRRLVEHRSSLAAADAAQAARVRHAQTRWLLDGLTAAGAPLPLALRRAAEDATELGLLEELARDRPDPLVLQTRLEEARRWGLALDEPALATALSRAIERTTDGILGAPEAHAEALGALQALVDVAGQRPAPVDLRPAQDRLIAAVAAMQGDGDRAAGTEAVRVVRDLGDILSVAVDALAATWPAAAARA